MRLRQQSRKWAVPNTLNEATYSTYLAGTVILSYRDQTVVLNAYARDFIAGRLLDKIEAWFGKHLGEPITITFEVSPHLLSTGKE
jgi:hypothetical protein